MKITNHNPNNTYDIDTYVMRGTIEMTPQEWREAYSFLQKKYKQAAQKTDTYPRDSLASIRKNSGLLFSVGVPATQLLFKKYKLKNYKNQNYGIKITK